MQFLWPDALWLLLLVPVVIVAYVALLRRRRKFAVRHSSLPLLREALGPGARLRPHIPPLLLLLALIAAIVASGRLTAEITLPSEQRTILLAMDVSRSMRATDVAPSRMVASQTAAKAFVQEQPADVRIGIVTFAASASLVAKPTRDRDELLQAIDQFKMQFHTAIGSGLLLALATLFPDDGFDLEHVDPSASPRESARKLPSQDARGKAEIRPPKREFTPVAPGANPSMAIILLTDGRRTIGPDALDVARQAALRGVRVYTVGFGSAGGGEAPLDGYSVFMRFDEEVLKGIAAITKGEYFHAGSAADLKRVYQELNASYVLERRRTEVTSMLAALAAALALAAAALSVRWFGRLA